MKLRLTALIIVLAFAFTFLSSSAQNKQPKKDVIPHGQSSAPGPALSPQEAIKKMQVPPGFHVELVAAEPTIVNPVAMTFDERGRIWITESLEYPKKAAGPGRDRVKVLESTKGDGKFDKVTTVIEGLNIPSGIAIGHGGVWVANSPDILFYPFEDFATPKLGKPQVVVTGFGRTDTHELPNSLTWGPDGWLYGLNGVFNHSHVKHKGKDFKFTCALFRIHPKTKDFEIFCEGTSNPWGLAINENGDFFVSACVIDHLWHLTETGYYHRQGGPYPPYTWKIGSIVKHKHQKAAYCGLVWFDSDAYPPEYREKLYMGNIHGGAINCDQLEKDGSTYFAKPGLIPVPKEKAGNARPPSPFGRGAGGEGAVPQTGTLSLALPGQAGRTSPIEPAGAKRGEPWGVGVGSNFLVANDAWFMPVAQKVGPDGCLYILDWYDRYHCYQDANRDPAGIDRLHGRLYRVVYGDYKPARKIDLSSEESGKLVERLDSNNVYFRETAQRLLTERIARFTAKELNGQTITAKVETFRAFMSPKLFPQTRRTRMHAAWAMIGGGSKDPMFSRMMESNDAAFRAWGIRVVAKEKELDYHYALDPFLKAARDHSPDVQLQVAIAAGKIKSVVDEIKDTRLPFDPLPVLLDVLTHCGDDKLIPHIVWQNLHPLLEKDGERFLTLAAKVDLAKAPGLAKVLPRAIDRILGNASGDPSAVVAFVEKLTAKKKDDATAAICLAGLTSRIRNNEMPDKQVVALRKQFKPTLVKLAAEPGDIGVEATLLLAVMIETEGMRGARILLGNPKTPAPTRVRALEILLKIKDDVACLVEADKILQEKQGSVDFRGQIITALGGGWRQATATTLLKHYPTLEPELQPKVIETLTRDAGWATILFGEIAAKKISKDVINVNQARRLLATKDKNLAQLIEKHWGVPRDGRNPEREKIVAQMKELFIKTKGDPIEGKNVFKKVCGQCHRIYGGGVDVGPDVTSNGRADFDQLLSNIFDPSLVIGSGYQSVVVNTKQGQVINGLLVEDSAQRVVLKVQGGELKTIARKDVDEQFTSKLSMMPENLETQMRPQEIVDLLEFLTLDRSPDEGKAKRIPGTPR